MPITSRRLWLAVLGACMTAIVALPTSAGAARFPALSTGSRLTGPDARFGVAMSHYAIRATRFTRLLVREPGHPLLRVRATMATAKRQAAHFPVIRAVVPIKITIGAQLTIVGRYFVPGNGKDTVVFQRTGSAAVFAKAATATSNKITVVVPAKLEPFLSGASKGAPLATQFHLRILAKRFSQSQTVARLSPIIGPAVVTAPAPVPTCEQLAHSNPNGDQDNDGLSNALELKLGTDPCNPDTDGDGVSDGYEYYAALDLNGSAYPYPSTEPWPNPLDPSDANDDFDGDGLTMLQEYNLWKYVSGTFPLTAYSDGTQNSGGPMPVTNPQMATLDLDGDGDLEDGERDADGDGLSNIVELRLGGVQSWWTAEYNDNPYTLRHFSGLSPENPDSDGDGIPDGLDDQDNDGWDNFEEMQLGRGGTGLRVDAYNPCLPNPYSLTCSRFIPLGGSVWPPFDGSEPIGNPNANPPVLGAAVPFTWPTVATASPGWNGLSGPQGPGESTGG